jgi:hypothetical protein
MIDFKTGYAELQPEHKQWLDTILHFISQTSSFYIDLVGYASKVGNHQLNQKLSGQRAASVANFLQRGNNLVYPRIRHFLARGDEGYQTLNNSDNSADERAVELLLYLGDIVPPPPHNVTPHPNVLKPPLPGGPRSTNWSVAGIGGLQVSLEVVATAGVNVFKFRNDDNGMVRTYCCPGAGPGGSVLPINIPKLVDLAKTVVKALVGGLSYSPTSFSKLTTINGFNFDDLNGATGQLSSVGAGVIKGYQMAWLKVYGDVWHYDSYGQPWFANADFCSGDVSGKDWQLGAGASSVGGPLIEI